MHPADTIFREVNIELHVCRINSASDDWLRYEFIIVNLYAFLTSQYSGWNSLVEYARGGVIYKIKSNIFDDIFCALV